MRRGKRTIIFIFLFCLGILMAGQKEAKAEENVTKGSYTYFAKDGIIYKMHSTSGNISKVLKVKRSNTVEIYGVKGNWLYLTVDDYFCKRGTDTNWKYVCRVKTNGKGLQTLAKGDSPCISGNYIYYIAKDFSKKNPYSVKNKGIARMSLDGKNKKILNKSCSYYYWAKAYNGRIYFSGGGSSGGLRTYSVDQNGKDLKEHAACDEMPYFYKNVMYYSSFSSGRLGRIYKVYSQNLSDGTTEYLADGLLHSGYGSVLYYTSKNSQKDVLYRYNISNKKAAKVCSGRSIRKVIGGKKWLVIECFRNSAKKNITVDRIRLDGKSKKTVTAFFRS